MIHFPKPHRHYAGIDPAWSAKNPGSLVVIDAAGRLLASCYTNDPDTMLGTLAPFPDAAVGIDAPMIIPNATGHRPNERDFLRHFARYGLGVHAANQTLFARRFPDYTGFTLYTALQARGFDFCRGNLYEVYPHATILARFSGGQVLRYKSGVPRPQRITALRTLQSALLTALQLPDPGDPDLLKGKALKAREDFLDALVCAYTLKHCAAEGGYCFGDPRVGMLLTPVVE